MIMLLLWSWGFDGILLDVCVVESPIFEQETYWMKVPTRISLPQHFKS
jgi:hypothetical protein